MKTILLYLCLVLMIPRILPAKTQARPSYLDKPSRILLVGTTNTGEALPLAVFLPYTTADAQRFYDWASTYQPWQNYIAVIPYGVTQSHHYLPDFWSFIQWYEDRILNDIQSAKKKYFVDEKNIYLQGFSLGGDLGWAFIIRHKELFRGAYIIGSRTSYPAKTSDLKYLKNHGKKVILSIGKMDAQVRKDGMKKVRDQLKAAGVDFIYQEFDGGHSITRPSVYQKSLKWMTE